MNFTNHGENKMADWVRGQGLSLPASWYIAAGSAASDSAFTEISGSGVGRATITSNLTNWAGTQGAGTTLASTGSSHLTSNNIEIDMGTASGAVGTVSHIGLFDAAAAGNCWAWAELETAIVTANGVDVVIPVAGLAFTLGLSGGMSKYLANKAIDKFFRGQSYTFPASMWIAALTAAPTHEGGGTEVGGGVNYGRAELAGSLAAISGTQSAGSTTASSGTAGRISNNALIEFAAPSGSWGSIGWATLNDASTAGNLLWWAALASTKTVGVDRPLKFAANTIGITWA